MQLRAPWAVLEGLLSVSELVIKKADAIGSILSLYETKGFGFSDLMIRQAARRSGSHHLATFDKNADLLDDVELVELNRPQ